MLYEYLKNEKVYFISINSYVGSTGNSDIDVGKLPSNICC